MSILIIQPPNRVSRTIDDYFYKKYLELTPNADRQKNLKRSIISMMKYFLVLFFLIYFLAPVTQGKFDPLLDL